MPGEKPLLLQLHCRDAEYLRQKFYNYTWGELCEKKTYSVGGKKEIASFCLVGTEDPMAGPAWPGLLNNFSPWHFLHPGWNNTWGKRISNWTVFISPILTSLSLHLTTAGKVMTQHLQIQSWARQAVTQPEKRTFYV